MDPYIFYYTKSAIIASFYHLWLS